MAPVFIESSAPTRIDLAGGTVDIWPLYLFHDGAQTINAAISLRAHCSIAPRADGRIGVRSDDAGTAFEEASWEPLAEHGEARLVALLLRHFGVAGVDVRTRSDSPVGAGIAGSSALNIAICGALARLKGLTLGDEELLQIAQNVEAQTIRVPTGVQDYRPALYGGVAAVELRVDGVVRVGLSVLPGELEQRLVLAYTGATRNSGINNWEMTKRHIDGNREVQECFDRIRDAAVGLRAALEARDWGAVASLIDGEWEARKRLAPGVTTPGIDGLIARARSAGALAAKVCGAGGGGCLFCVTTPERKAAVSAALAAGGARVLDFAIETEGLRVRTSATREDGARENGV
jgi:D-glycero-alpha-D-manno-heptose-7-phosphate kinase